MAKAGNAKGGFGRGAGKMGGPGRKLPPPASPFGKPSAPKPSVPRPMPPGVGAPSGSGPGSAGPMGAFKKGGPVKKSGC